MKIIMIVILFFSLLMGSRANAAPSESFQKLLTMMKIPTENNKGDIINEEIYQKYSLLVYGTPQSVKKEQRWKDVATGRWTNETTGQRGEYRILGYNLAGMVVNNEYFPDDYVSGTSPEKWNYIPIEDARSSWNDTEKYQTKEQYEYMLHQNLTRYGTTYSLTASSIGLEKARIEAFATWKTAGSIYTLKKDAQGNIWSATFRIPPMAAEANLEAKLEVMNGMTYHWIEGAETLEIPFSFGAEVTNLGNYAHAEDIQKITSEIEVEKVLLDRVQDERVTSIHKDNIIVVRAADYPEAETITITLKNTSFLETCFQAEMPMMDVKEITIQIVMKEREEEEEMVKVRDRNVQKEDEIARPEITSLRLYRKTRLNEEEKMPLLVAKKTNTEFICAGQVLVVEARIINAPERVTFAIEGNRSIQTLDELTKQFVYEEPKNRREKGKYPTLQELQNSYRLPTTMQEKNGMYQLEYIIPYQTKQTLHSWNTLRTENQNAFTIRTQQLFTRIREPYQIKMQAENEGGCVTRSVSLDVFERWDTIYNRDLGEYVK